MNIFSWLNKAFEDNEPRTTQTVKSEPSSTPQRVTVVAKPTPKLYTAEDVHRDLTAFVLLLLSDIQQEIERKDVPMAITRESSLLHKLGFKRSKNAQLANQITSDIEAHNKAYEEKKAALSFMQQAWATFGKDTMVIRYDKFFELLRKYNLVCGSFDSYTGIIPAENLADIERVTAILEKGVSFVEPFRYIQSVDTDGNDIGMLKHFNICPMSRILADAILPQIGIKKFKPILNSRAMGTEDGLAEYLDAARQLEYWRRLEREQYQLAQAVEDAHYHEYMMAQRREAFKRRMAERGGVDLYSNIRDGFVYTGRPNLTDEEYGIFIAAPMQEMAEFEITTYSSSEIRKQQEKEERRMREIRTKDPFICSLTHFGVMIYTKWGDEAQDEIIKRYEALSKAVNSKHKLISQCPPS